MKASDKQVWKPIPDYLDYEVSAEGRVRSWKPIRNYAETPSEPRELSYKTDKYGYKVVRLYKNGKGRYFTIHRLVLCTFNRKPEKCEVCRHLDGNRSNNNISNLKWGSPKQNSEDSRKHGTLRLGEKVNTAILTEEDVKNLRERDCINYSDLARKYGVTPATIRNAFLGVTWKHV